MAKVSVVFLLVKRKGDLIVPYKDTDYDKVKNIEDLADFRDGVKEKCSEILLQISSSQLKVFRSKDDTCVATKALNFEESVDGHSTKETALYVLVPDLVVIGATAISAVYLNSRRKRRWDELNSILRINKRRNAAKGSTAYSYVTWNEVKDIFVTTPYIQNVERIPEDNLNALNKYLGLAMKCFPNVGFSNESQRLHFIAPVIISVCALFEGDVIIEVEKDLDGELLNAHGHFEFVLRRGNKQVCIVEAKSEKLLQGQAQNLLGCEIAAEIYNLDKVFGIVTNFIQWNFLRNFEDKIELDIEVLNPSEDYMKESLCIITGKIYSMLKDD